MCCRCWNDTWGALLLQTLSMDAIAGLDGINVTGEVTLNDLTLQLKWSDIGTFPVKLLQVLLNACLLFCCLCLQLSGWHQMCSSLFIHMFAVLQNITNTCQELVNYGVWQLPTGCYLFSVQPMVRTVLSKVIIPILNINMKRGFPLPVIPAIDLQDADVRYDDGCILICSNVYYKSGYIKTFTLPSGKLYLQNVFS